MRIKIKRFLFCSIFCSLLIITAGCSGNKTAEAENSSDAVENDSTTENNNSLKDQKADVSTSNTQTVSTAEKSENAGTKTYTDSLGREVELSTDIQKIVCVRYMELNMLAAMLGDDFDDKVISLGMSVEENDFDNYKKYSEIYDLDKLNILGSIYDDNISVEDMLDLAPDIIIADVYFKDKGCIQKMIEAGLPVVFTDCDGFYGPLDSMQMLGEILGVSERTNDMVTYAKGKIESVLDRIDTLVDSGVKRPTLYFECGNTVPSELGQTRGDVSSGWGYLWNSLGADNIGVGHDFEVLDPEIVLSKDPDVIVIGGSNWDKKSNIMRLGYFVTEEQASEHLQEYITNRRGWDNLSAVKNKRLYCVHFNAEIYPFSFSIIEYMAQMLWPEEFADLDPQADLEEFFEKYMPIDYSGLFASQGR